MNHEHTLNASCDDLGSDGELQVGSLGRQALERECSPDRVSRRVAPVALHGRHQMLNELNRRDVVTNLLRRMVEVLGRPAACQPVGT